MDMKSICTVLSCLSSHPNSVTSWLNDLGQVMVSPRPMEMILSLRRRVMRGE